MLVGPKFPTQVGAHNSTCIQFHSILGDIAYKDKSKCMHIHTHTHTHTHTFVQPALWGLYIDFHSFVQPNPNLNQFMP